MMTRAIVVRELREIFRQRVFQIMGSILFLLIVFAILSGFAYQQTIVKQIEAANTTARTHWESQSDKNQHSAAHYGVYLFKPKSPLSFWDTGIDKYVGSAIFIEPHGRNRPMYRPIDDSPLLARWGELTPAFVFLVLLPLLVIWLCSSAISREKELQTLKFVLSQGVSWRTLLFSKVLARWIVVLGFALPAFLVMALTFQFSGATMEAGIENWILMGLVYLLFLGVFIHMSVGLSAKLQNTSATMILMIGFWLASVWIVPRVSAYFSAEMHPVASAWSFDVALESEIEARGMKRHDLNNANLKAFQQELLDIYNVNDLADLPVNYAGLALLETEKKNDLIIGESYGSLFEDYQNQLTTVQMFGLISPFLAVKQLSMGLCKTDVLNFIHFQEEADKYRKDFNITLNKDLVQSGAAGERSEVRSSSFWREVPEFEYKATTSLGLLSHYGLSFLILGAWFIASLLMLLFSKPKTSLS